MAGQATDNFANRAGIVAANGLTSFPLIKARYKLTIAYGVQLKSRPPNIQVNKLNYLI
jgi:hypothetical protein